MTDARGDDPAAEWRRLHEAITAVRRDVQRVRAVREIGDANAAIFDAHLLLLDDAELLGDVGLAVDAGQAAAPAWSASITRIATELAALPDPYLQARAADVRDIGDQVLRALLGVSSSGARCVVPPCGTAGAAGVLVAADLTPAEAALLDPIRVAAVVLAFSSPTAHSVILLRARGIPTVVGAGPTVRVAHDLPVSLMFPMISTLDELIRARRLLHDAIQLAGRGQPADLKVGIMVQVPATALKAHIFAPHLDSSASAPTT